MEKITHNNIFEAIRNIKRISSPSRTTKIRHDDLGVSLVERITSSGNVIIMRHKKWKIKLIYSGWPSKITSLDMKGLPEDILETFILAKLLS